MNAIDKFLLDREKRVSSQEILLKNNKNSTLIIVRINYPGLEKSNYIADQIVKTICREIQRAYEEDIINYSIYKNSEGFIGEFLVALEAIQAKKDMIYIEENHILGRCVDIDIHYTDGDEIKSISRSQLNAPFRKCFLCHLDAKVCSRAQSHDIEEIKVYFEDKYKDYTRR